MDSLDDSGVVTRKLKTWLSGAENTHVAVAALKSARVARTVESQFCGMRFASRGDSVRTLPRLTLFLQVMAAAPTPQGRKGLVNARDRRPSASDECCTIELLYVICAFLAWEP